MPWFKRRCRSRFASQQVACFRCSLARRVFVVRWQVGERHGIDLLGAQEESVEMS